MVDADDPLDIVKDFRAELSKERQQNANLTQMLKELERTHTHDINQIKSLLEAEQEKTLKLKHLLSDRHSAHKATLEAQLQDALDSNQRLKAEVAKLKRYAEIEGLEKKLQEQDSKNYALSERVKQLEREVETVREDALNEIRSKETKIVELSAEVTELQEALNEPDLSIDYFRSPEPLQRSMTREIRQKTDELESQVDKITIEKWQLAEEIQDLKTHYEREIQIVMDQTKQETESLKSKTARLQMELKDALDELKEEREKAVTERERRRQLMDDMHFKEDAIDKLKGELDMLSKSLMTRQQKIEKLENEINRDANDDYDFIERVKELTRLNSQLQSQLREKDTELRAMESERLKLENVVQANQREIKKLQHDKKEHSHMVKQLEEDMDTLRDQLRQRDERVVAIKEDLQQEMASRILELRQEKMILEERIEELQESADFTRKSIDLSIHDELASLDDFRPHRLSTPKDMRSSRSSRFFGDGKVNDSLKVEIGEKDYIIKTLKAEKEALEKQVADMHEQLYQSKNLADKLKSEMVQKESMLLTELKGVKSKYRFHNEEMENEIIELRSDIEKFQHQALRSAELWAEECNLMRTDLQIAERAAITAKLQYAEAATDLEILKKQFNDSKVKKSRFSFLRRNKLVR
mmetsp:Transcript_9338/g.17911  ORF Transcript_9338/g.17911 Transcript_9338/m.17911 type:complete len:643 (-) Transcript_9338:1862-3790(-)|eukprot:CAMPEP_0204917264 /NCGR_PEP_ID=MMETSP1397-20131031/14885_1 /ASSEMBLY_ACC=CAM_ASM_000891 /TAXON_ID=49980 /ORGANISM="Climacostomum Climacostomum virens, Strain Stock W-24" /LENGTH=642 /DNA_ID=CAMNT_0052090055 /DNA_START=193 /DNA_END=2121 /DNA_ORIENTATION=+